MPTLIVWGAKDEFAPVGGAHRFHKQIPGSRLVVLDDAGHYVMEDASGAGRQGDEELPRVVLTRIHGEDWFAPPRTI